VSEAVNGSLNPWVNDKGEVYLVSKRVAGIGVENREHQMRILESRLGWNMGRKPRKQENSGPIRDGDGTTGLLLWALGSHKAQAPFDASDASQIHPSTKQLKKDCQTSELSVSVPNRIVQRHRPHTAGPLRLR